MYGNHKLIVVQLLSLIVQLTCTHCAIEKTVKCIHVWVPLCVEWVPTFKFDKVGKGIQKSILKQLCTHKRTTAKSILFMCNTKQQRCQLVPTYYTTEKESTIGTSAASVDVVPPPSEDLPFPFGLARFATRDSVSSSNYKKNDTHIKNS